MSTLRIHEQVLAPPCGKAESGAGQPNQGQLGIHLRLVPQEFLGPLLLCECRWRQRETLKVIGIRWHHRIIAEVSLRYMGLCGTTAVITAQRQPSIVKFPSL